MIKISVPYLFENMTFYNGLKEYMDQFPDTLIIPCELTYVYGAFPFSVWAGSYNFNRESLMFYKEIEDTNTNSKLNLRLDCSNLYIQPLDVYDRHMKVVLDLLQNKGVMLDVAQPFLFDYINNEYPNGFVFSLMSFLNFQASQEYSSLNDKISLISTYYEDNINNYNKDNIEIIIQNKCKNCDRQQQIQCCLNQQSLGYNYSIQDIYLTCPKVVCLDGELLNELKYYVKLGFSNFKIDYPLITELNNFNNYLITNFIKPEYQKQCKEFISQRSGEI